VAEKRSLFDRIFGRRPSPAQVHSLRMMNQFNPTFTMMNDAYDSDVVRAAVDAIARNAAKLKAKHVRRMNGQVTPVSSNVEYLLGVRPNPYMDGYSFLYKVVTQLYLQNNAYIFIDWGDNGQVRGFYPVNSLQVEFVEAQGQIFVKFAFLGGQQVTLPYQEIIHLRRFFYKNDLYGENSARAIMPTLELINTTNEGLVNAVKSSASLRGLLKFSAMMKPEDMKKQRDAFISDYLDVSNNGGIAATDSKAEYVPLSNDPKMVDARQMELIEDKVFKYFNVNSAIVKSDYSEQQWNAFYESVLEPIAIQLSLEFTSKVFTDREQGWGNELIFEANRLQYASNQTKISLIQALMDRGLMSMNEAREIFNLSPIEDGEKRIVSLNYVDASIANQYQLGGAPNGATDTQGQGVSQDGGVSTAPTGPADGASE
jgi:HK97 family phage portal protein